MRSHFVAGFKTAPGILAACALAACTGGSSSLFTDNRLEIAQGFTVGGTVSGLTGSGLALQNNSGDTLAVAANGSFTFHTLLLSGNTYNVTVSAQPGTPAQTCVVGQGIGTVAGAAVANITVMCANKTAPLDAIGGTVQGLSGSGLVLQNDGADDLAASNGPFTFPTALASGMPYNVTVRSPPLNPYQDCTVANGSGTTGGSDVNNVSISCTTNSNPAHTIGGTISGLSAAKGTIVIQDNGRDNLTISADGPFSFAIPIPSGSFYNVTSQSLQGPQSFTCAFTNGSGQVGSGNVTAVSIVCATSSPVVLTPISVNVAGLAGSGLVLQDNAADNLNVAANGISTFPTALVTGSGYSVSVLTQPLNPSQSCADARGEGSGTVVAGTAVVVDVFCTTNSFAIGGTVTGSGGARFTLQDNGGDTLLVPGDGPFQFQTSVLSGGTYNVTVATQPPGLTCVVSNGSGTVGAADVSNVTVLCAANTYTVGGTVSGLSGTGLVLQDNGGANLSVSANGAFVLPGVLLGGAAYNVTVLAQPAGPTQTCTVSNGAGVIGAANVVNVAVTCTTTTFTVGGTVSGLSGTGLTLRDNGGAALGIAANGAFTFPAPVASGATYAVTVATQPAGPTQTCAVTNGSGTIGAANVINVAVTCTTTTFTVGGTVSGLSGTGLTLQDNGGAPLSIGANGGFTFPAPVASGATYAVTVATPPSSPTQTCTVTNGGGTIGAANVINVTVTCSTSAFTVGGTVSGLTGVGLALQNNGGAALGIAANGAFTFPAPVASGATYTVTVSAQPTTPAQTCLVTNGTGTIVAANVTNVAVTCSSAGANEWTWTSGNSTTVTAGVYGTLGVPAIGNIPGTRAYGVTFVAKNGLLWLFGGSGYGNTTTGGSSYLNDLWQYDPAANLWAWMGGPQTEGGSGVYGTLGVPAAANLPGSRYSSAHWSDAAGNFWLFGGNGLDSTGTGNTLSDLWMYNTTTALWTWINGPKVANSVGVYGSQGQAAAANVPGSRELISSWTDAAGNFWIFGGYGYATVPLANDYLNDLWMYSPTTGQWTWEAGANALQGGAQYGTLGVAAPGNTPGARSSAATWTDGAGNLWLFGGDGFSPASGQPTYFNDLWKFTPSTGLWTWVGGANVPDQPGIYGTQGTAAAANIPGGRTESVSFVDRHGNFWLFGGLGLSSSAICCGSLNDMWEFNPSTGLWTWMNGSNASNIFGTYGTLGVPGPATTPGSRREAFSWTDSGDFFMQGGLGYGATTNGLLNDLWEYDTGP